jgi:hypothetical protein
MRSSRLPAERNRDFQSRLQPLFINHGLTPCYAKAFGEHFSLTNIILPILLVMLEIHPMNGQPRATPYHAAFVGDIQREAQ